MQCPQPGLEPRPLDPETRALTMRSPHLLLYWYRWYIAKSTLFNLHLTSRLALALTVEFRPFSAEHQYFPEWFLLVSNISVSPWPTVSPSLIHVIFGAGFPEALQWNVAVADSSTVWSAGVVIKLGATETKNVLNAKLLMNNWNILNQLNR